MNGFDGARAERLAFAWCRIATVCLLFGPYALPVAAALSAALFLTAHFKGKQTTDCWFRLPLLAAGFWLVVLALWIWIRVR